MATRPRTIMVLHPAKQVQLGPRFFRSTQAAVQFVEAFLEQHVMGTAIGLKDRAWVEALFWRHPQAKAKAGPGIEALFVGPNTHGRPEFFVRRVDGTVVNWFYQWCLRPKNVVTRVRDALRWEVRHLQAEAKADNPCRHPTKAGGTLRSAPCEECHTVVPPEALFFEAFPPFLHVVDDFVQACQFATLTVVPLRAVRAGWDGPEQVADRPLARAWRKYFRGHTMMRWVCRDCWGYVDGPGYSSVTEPRAQESAAALHQRFRDAPLPAGTPPSSSPATTATATTSVSPVAVASVSPVAVASVSPRAASSGGALTPPATTTSVSPVAALKGPAPRERSLTPP